MGAPSEQGVSAVRRVIYVVWEAKIRNNLQRTKNILLVKRMLVKIIPLHQIIVVARAFSSN